MNVRVLAVGQDLACEDVRYMFLSAHGTNR